MMYAKKILLGLCLLVMPLLTLAATVPAWDIQPKDSSLTFTATQNGSPVSGQFKHFTGTINFDPDQLAASNVTINVDMGSVSAAYSELVDTLKTADWFNIKLFPQAVFKASEFTKTGDKDYQAKGTLTIRDKTVPVTLVFTQEEYSATKAKVKGSVTLKRTMFGIGQGEWSSTSEVKDDVVVNFELVVVKQ